MAENENKLDKLRIGQWNIQGLRSKYEELRSILNNEKLLVACLQETLLGDSTWQPPKHLKVERSPNINGGRGVAVVLHSSLQYTRLPLQTTLETVAVSIHSGRKITICSIYLSPNSNITKDELLGVIRQLPRPFLLLGDFNAKHPLWDSRNPSDQRGKLLENIIIEESLAALNDGSPTHYHIQTNSYSTIDLSLCSIDALGLFNHRTDKSLHGSDHFPLYLNSIEYLPQHGHPRWKTGKADWELFLHITEEIQNIEAAEPLERYKLITEKIVDAALASIPRSDGYYLRCPVPWWNEKCEISKKERNKTQKALFQNPSTSNKIKYKRARGIHQRIIKDSQVASWKSYVSNIDSKTECGKVWKRVNKIKGKHNPRPLPTLKIQGNTISDPQDVANVFAKYYESVNSKTKRAHSSLHAKSTAQRRKFPFNKRGGHPDNEALNTPFTLEEMLLQLQQCKDTSPGLDNITIAMLNHLSTDTLQTLVTTFSSIWLAELFPESWSVEVKLPILKPGKDPSQPESFRPISLTSCLCKLFERMVNHRLMWFLEKNNILAPQQSGFRKNKSTMDSLSQLTSYIQQGFQEKKHTSAIFFDMEKAYDTVWRDEILNSLYNMGLRGKLPTFIQNFLSNRVSCVRVGATHSDFYRPDEGLPQGSVLSVTCFAIAINDITKQVSQGVQCTLYVDDFTIFISARNEALSNRALQRTVNGLIDWTKTKGLSLSAEKTVAIKFEPRKKGNEPELYLNNNIIRVVESTKYLGLVLDKRLTWREHVEHLRTTCTPALNLLRHLSHLSWGADRSTLKYLSTALIQSKLDYGAHIYGATNSKTLQRLNPIQNASLRACTGAFRSSPAVSLCVESGVLPLEFSRNIISLKQFFKVQSNPTSLTHKALMGNPQGGNQTTLERLQNLLFQYQLTSPKILVDRIPETPPWENKVAKVCPFSELSKRNKPASEIYSEFLNHLENHQSNHIYTDGSKQNMGVGFASIHQDEIKRGRLVKEASIFTAEMYAIKLALDTILTVQNRGKHFTIFSDSQSVLIALKPKARFSTLAEMINHRLKNASELGIDIEFCWVPGHTGIRGNERADAAAKEASLNLDLQMENKIPHSDMKRPIREAVTRSWHRKWVGLGTEGRKLREIKEDIIEWKSSSLKNRRLETAIARLRIGHTNITHSYLMQGQTIPPECERCNVPLTVKHLLTECRLYSAVRRKYYNNPSLKEMLGNSKNFSITKISAFLKETGLLSKI